MRRETTWSICSNLRDSDPGKSLVNSLKYPDEELKESRDYWEKLTHTYVQKFMMSEAKVRKLEKDIARLESNIKVVKNTADLFWRQRNEKAEELRRIKRDNQRSREKA